MKQREDTKTGNLLASANARRQAAFKARWIEAGWKRKTLWVIGDDYDVGERAGRQRFNLYGLRWPIAPEVPEGVHPASWLLGYAEGLGGSSSAEGRALPLRAAGATVRGPTMGPLVGRKASRARSGGAS